MITSLHLMLVSALQHTHTALLYNYPHSPQYTVINLGGRRRTTL